MKRQAIGILAAIVSYSAVVRAQTPVGSTINYQAELRQSGNPVTGTADFRFRLYAADIVGTQVGTEIAVNGASLTGGRFGAPLDFGATAFGGEARWLEIDVRSPAGAGSFVTLTPRQRIMPAPVARFAVEADVALAAATASDAAQFNGQPPSFYQNAANLVTGTIPDERLGGTYSGAVTFSNAGNVFGGSGAGLSGVNADLLDGLNSSAFLQSVPAPLLLSAAPGGANSAVVRAENSSALGAASGVLGRATGAGSFGVGVQGETNSTNGAGVFGHATAASGIPFGVYGQSDSSTGRAIMGQVAHPTGMTYGVWGQSSSSAGTGVHGFVTAASGFTSGVLGRSGSPDGRGVLGQNTAATGDAFGGRFESHSASGHGVYGEAVSLSGTTYGVHGRAGSPDGFGVYGHAAASTGLAPGVRGVSDSAYGYGVWGTGLGAGVYGSANGASAPNAGVLGASQSTSGDGVRGITTAPTGTTHGGRFESASAIGRGVLGLATSPIGLNYGGRFESASDQGVGVFGMATAATGATFGVIGRATANANGVGVHGETTGNTGVSGLATGTTGINYGVTGESASTSGQGVRGFASAGTGTNYGVYGQSASTSGRGVHGESTALAGTTYGVWGESASSSGRGVYGEASATAGSTYGVFGRTPSTSGRGVYGEATAASGTTYGVRGLANSASGYGVYSAGNTGASGTKSFRIDHPEDPTNRYLLHYSTESPEVLNAYSGTVTLDGTGGAIVELPSYFGRINRDPRYTLTAVGAPMPMLHVAERIDGAALTAGAGARPGEPVPACRFRIAGGAPGADVSWEVKAVRHDAWVRTRGAPVEVEKQGAEKGAYEHPDLYGQAAAMGFDAGEEDKR